MDKFVAKTIRKRLNDPDESTSTSEIPPAKFSKSTHQRNPNKSTKHVGAPTTQLSSDSNSKKYESQCSKQPEKNEKVINLDLKD